MANGYIDIVKVDNIIKKNFLHGKKVVPFLIRTPSVDIDSKNDLEYAKYLLTKKIEKMILPKNQYNSLKKLSNYEISSMTPKKLLLVGRKQKIIMFGIALIKS